MLAAPRFVAVLTGLVLGWVVACVLGGCLVWGWVCWRGGLGFAAGMFGLGFLVWVGLGVG